MAHMQYNRDASAHGSTGNFQFLLDIVFFVATVASSNLIYIGCRLDAFDSRKMTYAWDRIRQLEASSECVGYTLYTYSFFILSFFLFFVVFLTFVSFFYEKSSLLRNGMPTSRNIYSLIFVVTFIAALMFVLVPENRGRGVYLFNSYFVVLIVSFLSWYGLRLVTVILGSKIKNS